MPMRFGISCLLLLSVLVPGGCSSEAGPASEAGTGPAGPVAGTAAAPVLRGRAVFQQNCVTCHGPGGRGDGPTAYQCTKPPSNLCDADVGEQSRRVLFRKISRGGSGMPAFERLLSEQDRSDVVEYVRSLSPHPNRQQEADSHF